MTVSQFADAAKKLGMHWWDGAGVMVGLFLAVTIIWSQNDYLVYVALFCVLTHAVLGATAFSREWREERHRHELAVAFKEQLKAQEAPTHDPVTYIHDRVPYRPAAGRHRSPQLALAQASPSSALAGMQ